MRPIHRRSTGLFSAQPLLFATLLAGSGCSHGGGGGTAPFSQTALALDPHVARTTATELEFSGRLRGADAIRVIAPSGEIDVSASGGDFAVSVTLVPNRMNRIEFVGLSAAGERSLPVVTEVVQDQEAPELFVDCPADGAAIAFATVHVAGRVADRLSGAEGIRVTVNGIEAVVEIGIGTNGTFLAKSVPLVAGGPTTLTVEATDSLGNSATAQVAVAPQPPDTPRITRVDGDFQEARTLEFLPQPVGVVITRQGGEPFRDKLVTFTVARSDGQLSADGLTLSGPVMQMHTDRMGQAAVFWRLGTDAGCGNNRLVVTSGDVGGALTIFASAHPGAPKQIHISDGNGQRAEVRGPSALPLRVWVSDGPNGVEGIDVTFTPTSPTASLATVINGAEVSVNGPLTVPTGATGHAEVRYTLGVEPGEQEVEANFATNQGLPAVFTVHGLQRSAGVPTSFVGLVLDNARRPLSGATCILRQGDSATSPMTSDAGGRFRIDDIPFSGLSHLEVDGATVLGEDERYPHLGYEVQLVPQAENRLADDVLLPEIATGLRFDNTQDVVLSCPGIDGLRISVAAGSVRVPDPASPGAFLVPDATNPIELSISQVHTDDIPMPLPDGVAAPFAWTLQPAGTVFDPPARVSLPNMSGLPPASVVPLMSFDHDTGAFEIVASALVTCNGAEIETEDGGGIRKAGWGGVRTPPPPTTTVTTDDGGGGGWTASEGPIGSGYELIRQFKSPCSRLAPTTQEEYLAARMCEGDKAACAMQTARNFKLVPGTSCNPGPPGFADSVDLLKNALETLLNVLFSNRSLGAVGDGATEVLESESVSWSAPIAAEIVRGTARVTFGALPRPLEVGDGTSLSGLTQFGFGPESVGILTVRSIDPTPGSAVVEVVVVDPRSQPNLRLTLGGRVSSASILGGGQILNVPAVPGELMLPKLEVVGIGEVGVFIPAPLPPVPNGVTAFGVVPISAASELPTALEASATLNLLTPMEPTAMINVVGLLSGGVRRPLPGEAEGTTFATSNPAIVSVSSSGVVTLQGDGLAYVTARNDGIAAVVAIQATTGPLTTVEGFVQLPDGTPAPGAVVTSSILQSTTAMDFGRFSLERVPASTPITLWLSHTQDGQSFRATVQGVPPRPGQFTDVGIVTLAPASVPNEIPVFERMTGLLRVFDLDGGLLRVRQTNLDVTNAAMDPTGDLWVTNGTETLRRVRWSAAPLVVATGLLPGSTLASIAVAPDDTVWAMDTTAGRLAQFGPDASLRFDTPLVETDRIGEVAIGPYGPQSLDYHVFYVVTRDTGGATGVPFLVRHDARDLQAPPLVKQIDTPEVEWSAYFVRVDHDGLVWVAMDARGGTTFGVDRLVVYQSDGTLLKTVPVGTADTAWGGLAIDAVGTVWATAAHPQCNCAFVAHFDRNRILTTSGTHVTGLCESFPVPFASGLGGCWLAADGRLWATCNGSPLQLRIYDSDPLCADSGLAFTVPTLGEVIMSGDPTGYVLANTIHPARDFDGDGFSNRAELQAGRNPFLAGE
jgi:hypothetical protein